MRSCIADRCVQAEHHLARAWSGIFHRELCSTTHEDKPASVEAAAAWKLPECSAAHLQQQPRWPLPPRLLARQSAGPFAAVDTSIDFMLWPTAARPLGWSLPPVAADPGSDGRPAPMEAASVKRKRLKKMNRHKQRKLRRRERNKS